MLRATKRRLPCSLLLTVGFLFVAQIYAQELKIPDTPELLHLAPPPSDGFPAKWYPRVGDGTDVMPAPILDRPFQATVETVTPYKSETGDTLRHVTYGFQARDRLGRTRTDSENGGMAIEGQMVKTKTVIVGDPVSHGQFDWTQSTTGVELPREMRVAAVTCGPQTLRYKEIDFFWIVLDSIADGTKSIGDTTTKTEHLASIQIDGLTVNRLRVSNTRLDEHGQVKTWSSETWYSPQLREVVRSLGSEDEGYQGLKGIYRGDPDPKLFYPPDEYRIQLRPLAKPTTP